MKKSLGGLIIGTALAAALYFTGAVDTKTALIPVVIAIAVALMMAVTGDDREKNGH